jgi:hypothetical protein
MAQQTAIDWFVNKVFGKNGLIIYAEIIQEAKEMEKEQIIDAHNHGEYNSQFMDALDDINGIEYYNKTYTK